MPRKPRTDFLGAWQHVMHRGARRAPIFKRDSHCTLFLDTVAEMVDRFEIEVHAYSLMPNHYHLLMRSIHANISRSMRYLNATYTQRVNRIHRWDGPVFRGRFHSQAVKDESSLPFVLAYIHLNPLRANLVTRLEQECWTSHREYIGLDSCPDWLSTRHLRGVLGGAKRMHKYVLGLHQGAIDWPDELSLRRGWIVEEKQRTKPRFSRRRDQGSDSRFIKTEELLEHVCEITNSSMRGLRTAVMGPGANPARRFAAWALARYTPLTQREIGVRLRMSPGQVAKVITRLELGVEPFGGWKDALSSAAGG
jgi:REP element-mobilizing transposase RayT